MSDAESELIPRVIKVPDTEFVQNDRLVDWISEETDMQGQPKICRIPEPKEYKFKLADGFRAAGMLYTSVSAMAVLPIDNEKGLFKDMFGRNVLVVRERFPCFDSFDSLYENRYYRWLYIIFKGKLTCVYYAEGSDTVEVTEDVRVIPGRVWKGFSYAGVVQDDILRL